MATRKDIKQQLFHTVFFYDLLNDSQEVFFMSLNNISWKPLIMETISGYFLLFKVKNISGIEDDGISMELDAKGD